ncbi:uncharacterized protein LOC116840326 isoform X2 [Odontomachus brunneus]|uniref:uncharacterized protein LOC116840326 isoform X2 n=1 Tax=Odontomachus brunneus TaxID=486640 RepID=UPI0013F281C7|nr:uncharacterized protein LOC116840326 isoform X2 [Odontomachus brunneus]
MSTKTYSSKMSTKTTKESKPLVSTTMVVESSSTFKDTIKPSNEFMQVFKLTYIFSKVQSKFNKKQIRTIEIKMDKLFHKVINSQDTKFEDIITLAYICEHMCFTYMKSDQTEKLSAAKDYILRCLHLIKDKELHPKIILLTLRAYSQLSVIYHKQRKLESAIETLDKAVDLYLIYIEKHSEYDIPIDYEDIIIKPSEQINGYSKLKALYIFILEISTDIHSNMKSKVSESFMLSRHLLLVDNLDCLQTSEECVQWTEKATIVCNYLVISNRFAEAKNYIKQTCLVQRAIVAKYAENIGKASLSEISMLLQQIITTSKLIILCQMRYGAALLCQSMKRLLRLEKNVDSKTNNSINKELSNSEGRPLRRLLLFYPNAEKYYPNMYNVIPFTYILKYNEAQKEFSYILNMMYILKLHLDFVEDVNFYIRCRLYTSNMYKYMVFYEKDTASQFLLQKRCAEILEEAANFLGDRNNSKLLRHLWLQLTIAYSTLIDMKLEDIEEANLPYLSQKHIALVDEINVLVAKSLIFLRKYMYSK